MASISSAALFVVGSPPGGSAPAAINWAPTTAVVEGQIAYYQGVTLESTATRTTGTVMDATEASFWTVISSTQVLTTFPASTYLFAGAQYSDGTVVWQHSSSRVTGATFNVAEQASWTQLTSVVGASSAYAGEVANVTARLALANLPGQSAWQQDGGSRRRGGMYQQIRNPASLNKNWVLVGESLNDTEFSGTLSTFDSTEFDWSVTG